MRRGGGPDAGIIAMAPFNKALLRRLADGRFHSGTELADEFGISRTAVWKQIRELSLLGLEVAAVPGRGYRAVSPVELLDETAIRRALSPETASLLAGLELHDHIDSTNTRLMRAPAGTATGTVCLAEAQGAGRGRMGRDWISPVGTNIYLSLLWRFDDPSRIAGLSLAVGVAAVRALGSLGLGGVGLKWPNDLLWGESKLGGILLEVAGEAHGSCKVVIGLGLNRYLPESAGSYIDQDWTDLSRIAGSGAPPRNPLIAALLNELLPMLRDYPERGLPPYLPDWHRHHRIQGREATVRQGGAEFRGRIADVTDEGLLVLESADGTLRQFASGDVRLRVARD